MTAITFDAEKLTVIAENHAGSSAVCAGISALMGALAKALNDSDYMLEYKPEIEFSEAKARIACKPRPEWKDFIFRSYWTVLEGVELISQKYPESCSFTVC